MILSPLHPPHPHGHGTFVCAHANRIVSKKKRSRYIVSLIIGTHLTVNVNLFSLQSRRPRSLSIYQCSALLVFVQMNSDITTAYKLVLGLISLFFLDCTQGGKKRYSFMLHAVFLICETLFIPSIIYLLVCLFIKPLPLPPSYDKKKIAHWLCLGCYALLF